MGSQVESKEWVMVSYAPEGLPTSDHLKLRTLRLTITGDSVPPGHVVLQLLCFSVDPYLRTRMTGNNEGLYFPQFELNQAVTAFGIGKVVFSREAGFQVGDVILHPYLPISTYSIVPATDIIRKVDVSAGISLLDYLGALGVASFAAWVALFVIADIKPGENVFVSAAAGAVGMYAGQLAKLKGCRVVGSTGTDEKVKVLKDEFGYDDAFNYKSETDYDAALSKYFPTGIDVYLDNVGGQMLEAVLNHVNHKARIPLCGMISQYNQVWTERKGVRNLLNMVGKDVKMEGFIVGSHLHHMGDFSAEIMNYMREGKLNSKKKIYDGIESFLEGLVSLFSSSNVGKVLVRVDTDMEA